ncbi:hypothetical protein C7H19_15460 [Aphanothece hegewaldii CCALA 016]|uniref:RES domain-containing protein n=1 Tax=Aphanothece hegewaldii CCALA 016 TaxID=2107694 RepID=A0A2T1LVZ7_9CHRO|nr:RES family NAD+ phosphorylase [Aphanothece hegewaldii]PSF35820.1 hypothetical protein C7H19_15460 [Aphanothece hegewaldii CCALA 016]
MDIWRITKNKHAATAFTGEGARRFGGRWNGKGAPMVYCASTLSLAGLETFVHMESEDADNLLVAIRATLPATLKTERLTVDELPANWRDYPAPSILADLGDKWIRENRTAVLFVPSVVIPIEENVLLNPEHPEFSLIEIGQPMPFSFDLRMWK